MLILPENCENIGDVMTNFDHSIDADIAERLKSGGVAGYPGLNFHGIVWFSDGQYHCAVKVYRDHVGTISADTCEDLMYVVSEEFGYD